MTGDGLKGQHISSAGWRKNDPSADGECRPGKELKSKIDRAQTLIEKQSKLRSNRRKTTEGYCIKIKAFMKICHWHPALGGRSNLLHFTGHQ
jgi:hypothetical protein